MGIDPPGPIARRGLILVSKILQNIANGIEADSKEEYMIPTNELHKKNIDQMKKFFAELAVNFERMFLC